MNSLDCFPILFENNRSKRFSRTFTLWGIYLKSRSSILRVGQSERLISLSFIIFVVLFRHYLNVLNVLKYDKKVVMFYKFSLGGRNGFDGDT